MYLDQDTIRFLQNLKMGDTLMISFVNSSEYKGYIVHRAHGDCFILVQGRKRVNLQLNVGTTFFGPSRTVLTEKYYDRRRN